MVSNQCPKLSKNEQQKEKTEGKIWLFQKLSVNLWHITVVQRHNVKRHHIGTDTTISLASKDNLSHFKNSCRMKTMSKSPARGCSFSRKPSVGTFVGIQSMVLPTTKLPVVVQSLTHSQIAAIPSSVYSVRLIGIEGQSGVLGETVKVARQISSVRRVGIVVKGDCAVGGLTATDVRAYSKRTRMMYPISSETTPSVRISQQIACHQLAFHRMPRFKRKDSRVQSASTSTEEKIVVAVELLKKAITLINEVHIEQRESRTNTDGGGDPDRGIFSPAIDENQLSDSVYKVKDQFFGNNDHFTMNGRDYNIMEFCYLVFLVLARMGIIINKLRKPYCEFLQEKVFMTEVPSVRSFNNCANKEPHKDFEALFPKLKFGFITRQPLDSCQDELYLVCHEIGWAFHETDYFKKLKRQKNSLDGFTL